MIKIDEQGYYGEFSSAYIPEMLHLNVEELRQKYLGIMAIYNEKSVLICRNPFNLHNYPI